MDEILNKEITTKVKRVHILLDKAGLMEHKYEILEGYNATSTKVLTPGQLDDLIEFLHARIEFGKLKDYQWAFFDKENQQHMYLLSLCQQNGWVVWNDARKRNIADLGRLGNWIKKYSVVKKPLLNHTSNELQKTIYQFEQMIVKKY